MFKEVTHLILYTTSGSLKQSIYKEDTYDAEVKKA